MTEEGAALLGPGQSISFDPVAADYDRTRSLSPRAMGRVLAIIESELAPHQPSLEIGVGTGRLALPLHLAGIRLAGIDLSSAMLHQLVAKAGGRIFPLALADAAKLPFRDASFGSGLAMHVLHVIAPWREALAELVRVVRPGGVIVTDAARVGAVPWVREIQDRFLWEAGVERAWPGANEQAEVDEAMEALGAIPRRLPGFPVDRRTTVARQLDELESGMYSFTWHVDPATRASVVRRMRPWARRRFGPLEGIRRIRRTVRWRAYDLPLIGP